MSVETLDAGCFVCPQRYLSLAVATMELPRDAVMRAQPDVIVGVGALSAY
jgi:hypothetical protein